MNLPCPPPLLAGNDPPIVLPLHSFLLTIHVCDSLNSTSIPAGVNGKLGQGNSQQLGDENGEMENLGVINLGPGVLAAAPFLPTSALTAAPTASPTESPTASPSVAAPTPAPGAGELSQQPAASVSVTAAPVTDAPLALTSGADSVEGAGDRCECCVCVCVGGGSFMLLCFAKAADCCVVVVEYPLQGFPG